MTALLVLISLAVGGLVFVVFTSVGMRFVRGLEALEVEVETEDRDGAVVGLGNKPAGS